MVSIKNRSILLVTLMFLLLSGVYLFVELKRAQDAQQEKIAGTEAASDRVVNALIHDVFVPYPARIPADLCVLQENKR